MKLKDLVEGLEREYITGSMDTDIKSIAYDSRKVEEGSLFVCIEGIKVDGHSYIESAIKNGASALLVQKDVNVPEKIAVVKTTNTRYGLAHVADAFYNHPSGAFSLIGITGTKGKTTITYMIKSILEASMQKVGLVGTIANMIGDKILYTERTTPESLDLQALFCDMVEKKVNSVVMEVSSQGLALNRVACSEFDIGVFTNLSKDHIGTGEHANMEEYLNAKIKLFKMCKQALINKDSEYYEKVLAGADCNVMTFGIENKADVMAVDIKKHPQNVEFTVITPWFSGSVSVSIPGKFSVYNALAAIGVCGIMGIAFENIKAGLESVQVPGRAELVDTGKDYSIMIDYAHTPDSLENILRTVKDYAPGRVVCVFGCGGDRDKTKRPMMAEVSGKLADLTIITSDNPRSENPSDILDDIEEGMKRTDGKYIKIIERREAIKYAIANAQAKDIIILAGKGHETYQIFKDRTIHFDEREVIREILNDIK